MSRRSRSARDDLVPSSQPRRVRQRPTNRPSKYRSFDGAPKTVRDGAIRSLAEQVIRHTDENGGRCRRGFLKTLLAGVVSTVGVLQITRDSVNNEVRRIRAAQKKASEQTAEEVSAEDPGSPSVSSSERTNAASKPTSIRPPSSGSISTLTNEQASEAPVQSEPVSVAKKPLSMALMAVAINLDQLIIKPFYFVKIAILSQIYSYSRSLVRTSLKILKYIGLKYGIIESNTKYFKPAYNNA